MVKSAYVYINLFIRQPEDSSLPCTSVAVVDTDVYAGAFSSPEKIK